MVRSACRSLKTLLRCPKAVSFLRSLTDFLSALTRPAGKRFFLTNIPTLRVDQLMVWQPLWRLPIPPPIQPPITRWRTPYCCHFLPIPRWAGMMVNSGSPVFAVIVMNGRTQATSIKRPSIKRRERNSLHTKTTASFSISANAASPITALLREIFFLTVGRRLCQFPLHATRAASDVSPYSPQDAVRPHRIAFPSYPRHRKLLRSPFPTLKMPQGRLSAMARVVRGSHCFRHRSWRRRLD